MSRNRLAEVILSVPPYTASPNQSTAPQKSDSLAAAQYMLNLHTPQAAILYTIGDVEIGSDVLENLESIAGIAVGWYISGNAIPAGTTVVGIMAPATVVMSAAAVASLDNIKVQFTAPTPLAQQIVPPAGLNTSISVNSRQVNRIVTLGPQPIHCSPCARPQKNTTFTVTGVTPKGGWNPMVVIPEFPGLEPKRDCCPPVRYEGRYD